jgi:hypothetical protein
MSDGSQFAGSISASPSSLVGVAGSELVLSRAVTSADDGAHACSVIATANGSSATSNVTVQVTPISSPPPPPPPPTGSQPLQIHGTPYPPYEDDIWVTHQAVGYLYFVNIAIFDPHGVGHFPDLGNVGTVGGNANVSAITGKVYVVVHYIDNTAPGATITGQYYLDNAPLAGAPIETFAGDAFFVAPFVFDSTTVADGVHVIRFKILDSNGIGLSAVGGGSVNVHIGNHGFSAAAQDMYVSAGSICANGNPLPDLIHFNGVPHPQNISHAYPYSVRPGLGGVEAAPGNFLMESIGDPSVQPPGGGSYLRRINLDSVDRGCYWDGRRPAGAAVIS